MPTTRILYIEASPRGDESYSSRAAREFLDACRRAEPSLEVDHLHLFRDPVAAFGAEGASQKMAQIGRLIREGRGIEASGEWAGVLAEIERLKAADKVLISAPMWNFSVPYPLKQWIDVVCQPGLTFRVNARGEYEGLVTGRPLQLILASGSVYPDHFPRLEDGTKADFQRAYLEHVARFIGFEDIRCIQLAPCAAPDRAAVAAMLEDRLAEARAAATAF